MRELSKGASKVVSLSDYKKRKTASAKAALKEKLRDQTVRLILPDNAS